MDEFGLIKTYFKPLAADYSGSLALSDDAAIIDVPPGMQLAITKDAISEGVHFLGEENPSLIAKKLLRVNVSDLAAMGASPLCYFLAAMLPKETDEAWVSQFAKGLHQDQERYAIYLAGGDTIATRGKLSFSVTAVGLVEKGKALKRSGAKPGDEIYVSGTLGDSALGLMSLRTQRNNLGWVIATPNSPREDDPRFLTYRYLLPEPHIALGHRLSGIATACIDVSDGLVQDLDQLCAASHVGATIHRHLIPRSKAAQALLDKDPLLWDAVTGGGDDYQLLFTVPVEKASALRQLANDLSLPLTKIGVIGEGEETVVLDENGKPLAVAKGFQHF